MKRTIELDLHIDDIHEILRKELGFEKIYWSSMTPIFNKIVKIRGQKDLTQSKGE